MTRIDTFAGAMAVVATASIFVSHACEKIINQPDWKGICQALLCAYIGCLAVSSVWRDRL
jgi:hypothetical protein